MKNPTRLRDAALVTGLTAIAITAFATNASLSEATWVPAPRPVPQANAAPIEEAPTAIDAVSAAESGAPLPSNERVMPLEAAALPAIPAAARRTETQPPVVVEERRLTRDERIQATVQDLLAQAPNLSGKIGVESRDAVVILSGYTTTVGQARRAGRYAGSVEGVKYVQNEIRARVGGSI